MNSIFVTNDHVCNADCGRAPSQQVKYDAPAADGTVLSVEVHGNAANDHFNVASTAATVPVRVELGSGNNVINVGMGRLMNILGISRPGLDAPNGLGPVVVVGGTAMNTPILDATTAPLALTLFIPPCS